MKLNEHKRRQLALAEYIVSSEAFMWLMQGSNHTEIQLEALRPAYRAWSKDSGGYKNYNGLADEIDPPLHDN